MVVYLYAGGWCLLMLRAIYVPALQESMETTKLQYSFHTKHSRYSWSGTHQQCVASIRFAQERRASFADAIWGTKVFHRVATKCQTHHT